MTSTGAKSTRAKTNFAVFVGKRDWEVLLAVIRKATSEYGECSWFGIGKNPVHGESIVIDRIAYPEQENTTSASDIDDLDQANLVSELGDDECILWWGHSHGNMQAFYSAKDDETWDNWMATSPPFFLGTCHNAKGETYQRVALQGYEFELASSPFHYHQDEELEKEIEEAMSKMGKPVPRYAPAKKDSKSIGGETWNGNNGSWDNGISRYPSVRRETWTRPYEYQAKRRRESLEEARNLSPSTYKKKESYSGFEFLIPNLLTNLLEVVNVRSMDHIELIFANDLEFPYNPKALTKTLLLQREWVNDIMEVGVRHGLLEAEYRCATNEMDFTELRQDLCYLFMLLSDIDCVHDIFPWVDVECEGGHSFMFGDTDYTEAMLSYYSTRHLVTAEEMLLYKTKEGKFSSLVLDRQALNSVQMQLSSSWWQGAEPDWSQTSINLLDFSTLLEQ